MPNPVSPVLPGTGTAHAEMRVADFSRQYRFEMVRAYSVISGVPNVFEATHAEIDAGFARCLENRNLRPTHELYLAARAEGAPI